MKTFLYSFLLICVCGVATAQIFDGSHPGVPLIGRNSMFDGGALTNLHTSGNSTNPTFYNGAILADKSATNLIVTNFSGGLIIEDNISRQNIAWYPWNHELAITGGDAHSQALFLDGSLTLNSDSSTVLLDSTGAALRANQLENYVRANTDGTISAHAATTDDNGDPVDAGGLDIDNAGVLRGNGGGLTFTNAAGKKFALVVNSTTNGFNFVPQ